MMESNAMLVPVAVGVLLAALERSRRARFTDASLLRPGIGVDLFYLLSGFVLLSWLGVEYSRWLFERGPLEPLWSFSASRSTSWLLVGLGFLLIDLGNYLVHWALHRSGFLWEFHKAHHSSPQLDFMATFRSHIVEQLLRRAAVPVLLVAVGVPLRETVIAAAFYMSYTMYTHSNLSFGAAWLERVLVTPRLHRIHHVPDSCESNLGGALTIWDRLRRTLVVRPVSVETALGVPGEQEDYPQTWTGQLVRPLRRVTASPDPATGGRSA